MFSVETRTIAPGHIYVDIKVINPAVVVAEYLARKGLGVEVDSNPDILEQRIIHGNTSGHLLFNSITSTPEFLAMVHASNGGLRWMDLRPCRWNNYTQVRLLAASTMVGYHRLLYISCLYNNLKNACPSGSNDNFRHYLERSIELEVMAEARRNQAKVLLAGRPMLAMQEAETLLQGLSDQIISQQIRH